MSAASSGSAPSTRTSGRSDLIAVATPEINPPPDIGTTTASTSGRSSRISRPMVPWPAITSGWSNGGISAAPRSATRASARSTRSVMPTMKTSAPSAFVASILTAGVLSGITIAAGTPCRRAANATACAWLPLE